MQTPTDTTTQPTTVQDDTVVTVDLDEPIIRGATKIASITLRKPNAGSLRGASLMDLAQMDVAALIKVLPRISDPTLTEPEVAKMAPADLAACGTEVATFLLRKRDRQQYR